MRVRLIVFPGFQMLAYVMATETLRIGNLCAGQALFAWDTRSADGGAVQASNGALVAPDPGGWDDGAALVLLCAGYDPPRRLAPGLRAYLARAARAGTMLGGLDTGTVILAQLGYLDGYQAVLHHRAEAGFRAERPEIAVSDAIYCLDGRRLTAAGGTATGDAMLAWIGRQCPGPLADATAEAMAHGVIRPGSERQRPQRSADPVLTEMARLMATHMEAPLPLTRIAAALRQSPKQLRRRCRAGLGETPAAHYLRLRLERSLDLLRGTEMPVREVAAACGFASLAGFSRSFRARFGSSPSAVRAAARRV